MSKLRVLAVAALAIMLSGSVYSAYGRGGGGGGGGRGGGAHAGGGGHFGGGMHGGGGARFSGMRGGGARFSGGARHFSGRSAISRSAARSSFRRNNSIAAGTSRGGSASRRATFNANQNQGAGQNRNAQLRSNAVRNALNSRSVAGALHNRSALHNPGTRARIAASAATAGWHGHGGRNGWWRHGNGGYGWIGPLFWPFAYYDLYDYAMWGYGYDPSFWGYGYNDIYAGMFGPYGYDDLAGYLPPGNGSYPAGTQQTARASMAANPAPDQLSQMCGEDSQGIAGLPIDQIQQAIQPNDAQRAALDELANASVKAAQDIKTACPTQIALTAPSRLAVMQARIEAMIAAEGTVLPPLENFYSLLNDEQKARLNALGQNQRRSERAQKPDGSAAQTCGAREPGVTDWPAAEIEATLRPTEAQRAALAALQDASAKAADMLKASCGVDQPVTPPARLAAVGKRLDVMLQAVKTVRAALDDFYGKLSDEQKAQFEAIGPRYTGTSDQPATAQTHSRRHHGSIGGIIRRLMSMAR
jgi:hypothetical protein